MPTEKPRITITMSAEQLQEVDRYRFENKLKNQTQAILTLIQTGLEEMNRQDAEIIEKASEAANAVTEASSDIEAFASILRKAGIVQPNNDISEADMKFLKAMFMALKAHFQAKG